jgi:hypothetical protein
MLNKAVTGVFSFRLSRQVTGEVAGLNLMLAGMNL